MADPGRGTCCNAISAVTSEEDRAARCPAAQINSVRVRDTCHERRSPLRERFSLATAVIGAGAREPSVLGRRHHSPTCLSRRQNSADVSLPAGTARRPAAPSGRDGCGYQLGFRLGRYRGVLEVRREARDWRAELVVQLTVERCGVSVVDPADDLAVGEVDCGEDAQLAAEQLWRVDHVDQRAGLVGQDGG